MQSGSTPAGRVPKAPEADECMWYCQDAVHWNTNAVPSASDGFVAQAAPVLPIVAVRSANQAKCSTVASAGGQRLRTVVLHCTGVSTHRSTRQHFIFLPIHFLPTFHHQHHHHNSLQDALRDLPSSRCRNQYSRARNAVTLEDPIEYELSGISQTQINTRKGMTFASGLRSILRQDPDIIMLGEIRDAETAVMAIQASLTGHMVFSTLHTNDAPSAVTRLLDLGIEPYLAASSLLAVLAQRLVRKICPHCKSPSHPTQAEQELLKELVSDQSPYTIYHGKGCDLCRGTGYRGRLGAFELLTIDDQIQSLITQRANAAQIRSTALRNGMLPMRSDGLQKVLSGKSTIEEIARVTVEVD